MLPRGELRVSAPRDLLVVRSEGCAFEPDGRQARGTLVLKDETGIQRHRVPQRMPEAELVDSREEEVAWGGMLNHHFGHFLTESVSRLWPLVPGGELDGMPVVFVAPHQPSDPMDSPALCDWLGAFGARIVELPEQGAVRFERMRVPEPAWRFNTWIAPEVRDIHLHARSGLGVPPAPRHEVVWLSRQGLAEMRMPYDEALLEWILHDRVTIVEPESRTLAEQVALLEGAHAVTGVMGSAFHALLMTHRQPHCLYLCPPWERSAYLAQHRLLGAPATFAQALSAEWTRTMRERGGIIFPFGYRLSIPAALRALQANVLPELFEDARIAAFAGAGPERAEREIDAAAIAVIRDPASSEARLRLGSLFEAEGLTRGALDQYRAAAGISGSAEADRRLEELSAP